MYKLGIIGAGNMSNAIISGILKNNIFEPGEIIVSDKNVETLKELKMRHSVEATSDNLEVISNATLIILAIKPQVIPMVAQEIRPHIKSLHTFISIAPGKTLEWLANQLTPECKLIRCMPNTPAAVLEGCTGYCHGEGVSEEVLEKFKEIFQSIGKLHYVEERLMDVVVGISGSSPAYVFMMIEAMADAGVLAGMPRKDAYEMSAQAVLGSAKMVLESGIHPGQLKDMVCSPGGTTIEAVRTLEKNRYRSGIIEAINDCIEKSRSL